MCSFCYCEPVLTLAWHPKGTSSRFALRAQSVPPISALDYGNEDRVQYTYDDKGRVLSATYEDGDTVRYAYDNSGTLATVSDSASGIKATYGYDYVGRLSVYKEQGGDNSLTLDYSYYVSNKQLKTLREVINGHVRGASYIYDDDTRLTSYQKANGKRAYTYDGFDRVSGYTTTYKNTGGTFGTVLTTGFTFASSAVSTTSSRVSGLRQTATGLDTTYSYTYDANGNILSVSDGTNTTSYVYDSANQLVRENNQAGGFTHIWVYDNAGNIQSRSEYAYTTGTIGEALDTVVYSYGDSQWRDLLTGYDGRNITSDTIGNMLSDGIRSYTWEHGRQLATVTQNGVTWQNTYNADGLRTKRTDGTNTYEYVYYGGLLQYMEHNGQAVYFTHAPDGTPMGMLTEGNAYFYITNLQGDVVGILNSSGQVVVQYTYDAWGNPLSCTGTLATTIGTLNPIRYRGYVYDTETQLYYLQSRYYDPEIGRFINADAFTSTGQGFTGNNMFAYCGNNPVNYVDPTGEFLQAFVDGFNQALKEASEVFAVALGVSQVDSLAPGPADVVAVGIAIGGLLYCIGRSIDNIASTASATKTKKPSSRTYSVYFLQDQNGIIQYVGRVADSGYVARMSYHFATRGLTPAKRVSGLSYFEARGLEEIGMIECHTINPSNPKNNQIHGIGINNINGGAYMAAATSYLFNRAENWLLELIS